MSDENDRRMDQSRSSRPAIPFNRPSLLGSEWEFIRKSIEQGHISGDGLFTRRCHQMFESLLGVPRVLLTTSCTHALEMAAILLEIGPGDEVIIPSFTFVSTVNAFVLRGATPVFADIRPDTLNMDEEQLESLITKKTRAIVPVHYAGVGCEMDTIMDVARARSIKVVEDNAHGLFGRYRGRLLGTFGTLATQSFHETKNITCGEGGAIVINDPGYVERAEIIREKGTDRARFFRGQVDKYSWVDIGSSYLPSDMLAAFLAAQLERKEEIQSSRERIWNLYAETLRDWAENQSVSLPTVPDHCEQPFHMFYLVMPSGESRDRLIEHLRDLSILSVFHYVPLHLSPMGMRLGGREGDCPVTESVSERLLRLPFYTSLSSSDQERVIDAVLEFKA
jgi:dTDP-4-amino-4,6-dideoxygalactose transaminase